MRAYKLVRPAINSREDPWLYSLFAPVMGIVKYQKDLTTTPNDNCGPLAAFPTVTHALEWRRRYQHNISTINELEWQLWACEIESSTEMALWAESRLKLLDRVRTNLGSLPSGTILCASIKLLVKAD